MRTIRQIVGHFLCKYLFYVSVIIWGYWFKWNWTGFQSKTLWDWLNLLGVLAIPAVVGFGTVWFTTQQGKVSSTENTDNQREALLQDYIDKMSDLLLKEHLRESIPTLSVDNQFL